ncbi:hypothetical protein BJP62_17735 [Jeongeupia sp. USM3]|nr:hypothetical protein BJP62_17735 [Jeongeupia sp. USM3]
MSSPAMTLIRRSARLGSSTSRSAPSTRKRTSERVSNASRCRSGPRAQRLGQQRIDQPDDRRIVLRIEQVFDLGQRLHQP